MGDSVTHRRLVRSLAAGVAATIVFVEYHRAPEHQYPIAIEEGYAATLYVSERAERFQVDSKRLAVVVESSGGKMATVVCLLRKATFRSAHKRAGSSLSRHQCGFWDRIVSGGRRWALAYATEYAVVLGSVHS
jgi:acetyl esterase/lipase